VAGGEAQIPLNVTVNGLDAVGELVDKLGEASTAAQAWTDDMQSAAMAESAMRDKANEMNEAFDEANDTVGNFMDQVKEGFSDGLGLAAFASVALGVAAALDAVKESVKGAYEATVEAALGAAEYAHQMETISIQTGIDTTSLQGFASIAALSGGNVEALARSVNMMQANIDSGSPKALAALEKLGLDASVLSQGPTQAIYTISDALRQLGDTSEQVDVAKALMGRGGAQNLPTLLSDLQAAQVQAQALGITMSSEDTEGAANFQKEVLLLGQAWDGAVRNFGAAIDQSWGLQQAMTQVTIAVGAVSSAIQILGPAITDAVSGLVEFGSFLATAFQIPGLSELIAGVGSLQDLGSQLSSIAQSQSDIKSGIDSSWAAQAGAKRAAEAEATAGKKQEQEATTALMSSEKALDLARAAAIPGLDGTIAKIQIETRYKELAITANEKYTDSLKGMLVQQAGQIGAQDEANATQKAQEAGQALVVQQQKIAENATAKWAAALATREFGNAERDLKDALTQSKEETTLGTEADKLLASSKKDLAAANAAFGTSLDDTIAKIQADTAAKQESISKTAASIQLMIDGQAATRGYADSFLYLKLAETQEASQAEINAMALKTYAADMKATSDEYKNMATLSSGIGTMLGDMGAGAGITGMFSGLTNGLNAASQAAASGTMSFASMATAIGQIYKNAEQAGPAMGALSGAMQGAAMGSAFGGIGAAIGAGVGGLIGLIGGLQTPEYEKVASDVGTSWGVQISDALAKQIASTETKDNVSRNLAEDLNISDIMSASGADPGTFYSHINDLMQAMKDNAVPAADATKELGQAFTQLQTAAAAGSMQSEQAMIQMIQRAKQLGETIPEITKAIQAELQTGTSGLDAFYKGIGVNASGVQGQVSAAQGQANEQLLGAQFASLSATEGAVKAAQDLSGAFADMQKSLPKGVTPTGDAATAMQMLTLLQNKQFAAAASGAAGLGQAAGGMIDSGGMTQSMVGALGTSIETLYNQALGAKGATSKTAEEAIAPALAQLAKAQALGAKLDPSAAALLAQAQKDGIVPLMDPAISTAANTAATAHNTAGLAAALRSSAGGATGGPAGAPYGGSFASGLAPTVMPSDMMLHVHAGETVAVMPTGQQLSAGGNIVATKGAGSTPSVFHFAPMISVTGGFTDPKAVGDAVASALEQQVPRLVARVTDIHNRIQANNANV
jgi:hypothetical protein